MNGRRFQIGDLVRQQNDVRVGEIVAADALFGYEVQFDHDQVESWHNNMLERAVRTAGNPPLEHAGEAHWQVLCEELRNFGLSVEERARVRQAALGFAAAYHLTECQGAPSARELHELVRDLTPLLDKLGVMNERFDRVCRARVRAAEAQAGAAEGGA